MCPHKWLLAAALFVLPTLAHAGCSVGALPFNLQNNTLADATQVMGDFNQIVNGAAANCAASGANNDITALSALSTPLGPSQGGTTTFLGGNSTGTASAQAVSVTPANTFALTLGYKVTLTVGAGLTTTGPTTLNVNGTGAIPILRMVSGVLAPNGITTFQGGEWVAGQRVEVAYDGANWQWNGYLSVADLLFQFGSVSNTSYGALGSFWTDINDVDGNANARIHAFRDRVMVDDATLQAGTWNGGAGGLANLRSGTAINSANWNWATREGSLNSISSWGQLAIVGQSVASSAGRSGDPNSTANVSPIGVAGFGLNDRTTNQVSSWGGYFEALRRFSTSGTALGIETDVGNVGAAIDVNPFTNPTGATGLTVALWNQCGGSAGGAVTYANCSAGLTFGNNGARWRKGLVFFNAGLDTSVGGGSNGLAIEFADSQSFRWLRADGVVIGEVWTTSLNSGTLILAPRNNMQLNGSNSWNGNGSVATVLGSTGPVGSHTSPQVWLTVLDNTGTVRYIPAF